MYSVSILCARGTVPPIQCHCSHRERWRAYIGLSGHSRTFHGRIDFSYSLRDGVLKTVHLSMKFDLKGLLSGGNKENVSNYY